uniref:Uncharacterized protein LOC114336788 n=1 Tax=Diabrotica virgifera virgifera TaxID=50390 RepID=A0A6P7G248_DIAVI
MTVTVILTMYYLERCDASDENSEDNEQGPSRKRTKPDTPDKTPTNRWRQRNEECYSRLKRKIRRNLGQPYVSDKTKKNVPGRELGPPCSCTNKCREKLQGQEINIFNEFWNLGSWELQNSYLFGCIDIVKKKRSYPKKQKHQESHRKSNAVYSINVNGETTRVCKTEFLNIHGL